MSKQLFSPKDERAAASQSRRLWLPATKHDLLEMEKTIMAKLSELAELVAAVNAQLGKAKDEVLAKIAALTAALDDVPLPEKAETALNDLKATVQAIDDIVPDAPTPAE
jgi:cytolysin (calcineurin-like family phosphatase)